MTVYLSPKYDSDFMSSATCKHPLVGIHWEILLLQARKQFKKQYPNNEFNDDKECDALIKCYTNFLTTGETRSPELYSLPHKAYGERNKPNLKPHTAETFGELEFGNKEVHNDTSVSGANTDKSVSVSTNDTRVSDADEQSASTGNPSTSDSEQKHSDNKL